MNDKNKNQAQGQIKETFEILNNCRNAVFGLTRKIQKEIKEYILSHLPKPLIREEVRDILNPIIKSTCNLYNPNIFEHVIADYVNYNPDFEQFLLFVFDFIYLFNDQIPIDYKKGFISSKADYEFFKPYSKLLGDCYVLNRDSGHCCFVSRNVNPQKITFSVQSPFSKFDFFDGLGNVLSEKTQPQPYKLSFGNIDIFLTSFCLYTSGFSAHIDCHYRAGYQIVVKDEL